jgi:succinyl-diaminopimelate desuccinylase
MDTDIEQLLAKLVGMPTITDDAEANNMALDYIEQYLADRGMHTQRFSFANHGALIASTRPDNAKTPTVLLAAHVDVVSGSDEVFKLRLEDGKLKGRGVYDMKFAIAGYMQLVDDLQEHLDEYDFAIMITSDEEYGTVDNISGTLRLLEAGLRPAVAILPDSTAPNWDIESLVKGYWRFNLVATGRTAHGSRPWEGESASFKLIQALHDLKMHFANHGPLTDTLNIGIIEGGVAFNQVPAHMTAAIEIRLIDDNSFTKNQALVQKLCDTYGLTFNTRVGEPPLKHNLDRPLVQAYMDSAETVTGRRPQKYVSLGGSDVIHFSARDIPCIVSCPEGGKHHSDDEWVDRKSFLQFVPILQHYVDSIAKIPIKKKFTHQQLPAPILSKSRYSGLDR